MALIHSITPHNTQIKKCVMGGNGMINENDGNGKLWEDGEIKLLMLIRHERLVSFMGAGETDGYRFLVVELMSGGSIEGKLWNTPQNTLTKRTRLIWAHDVALGLDIVHSKNFVHRDLKTPNILFDAASLRAKIADFGLGKSLYDIKQKDTMKKRDDDEDETKTTWSKCVMTGNAGSILWMAPEVMSNFYGQDAEYGGSVDVYAYGIVLWELVSHAQPWHDISDIVKTQVSASNLTDAIFDSVKQGLRPTLNNKMLEMMSPDYFKLMRSCWDSDPSKRPPFSKIKIITANLLEECKHEESITRAKRFSKREHRNSPKRQSLSDLHLSDDDDDGGLLEEKTSEDLPVGVAEKTSSNNSEARSSISIEMNEV
jgi:serine/threonine protein kinase